MATARINELTSNQYYKGLNNRFDNRVRELHRAGYRHDPEKKEFVRGFPHKNGIPVMFIMHADRRCYREEVASRHI